MTRVLPEVTVYAGPMCAGKTTRLYGKMGELTHLGVPYEAYRPGVDLRDVIIAPRGYIMHAHAALTPNCTTVSSLVDIPVEELVQRGIKTIFLEEWFMFGFDHLRRPIAGLYREVMGKWASAGIDRVYAAGLDQGASGNQAWWQMRADMARKWLYVRPSVNIQSMGHPIQNADVSHATARYLIDATTRHSIWRPSPTFFPKGCVQTITIVPCVRNICYCLQNRQSHLTPCRFRRLIYVQPSSTKDCFSLRRFFSVFSIHALRMCAEISRFFRNFLFV